MRRTAEHPSLDERFLITGLKGATLTLRMPAGARVRVVNAADGRMMAPGSEELTPSPDGRTLTTGPLTGSYYVAWQDDGNRGCMLSGEQMHPEKVTLTRR